MFDRLPIKNDMDSDRGRTKFEAAFAILIVTAGSLFVRVGQAGDTPRKDHSKIDCIYCHTPVADIASDEIPIFDASKQCGNCHRTRTSGKETQLTFHVTSSKNCTECHLFHETDRITAGNTSFKFRFDKRSSQMTVCSSCHGLGENPAMISEGHKRAAVLYHADYGQMAGLSPSQACMLCHSENASTNEASEGLTIPQFREHDDHPMSVKVVSGEGEPGNRIRFAIDPRLQLFNGKIECQTCHSLTSQSQGRLRDFASFTELCNGCHILD
jgi:hypothetical protein